MTFPRPRKIDTYSLMHSPINSVLLISLLVPTLCSAAEPTEKVLHRETVRHGEVTGLWLGTDPGPGVSPAFGTERLVFLFKNPKERLEFHPKGQLFFSDWSFHFFSPDGKYIALPQDHYGPYHLVPVSALRAYLHGKKARVKVVKGTSGKEGAVHSGLRWLNPKTLQFNVACCGEETTVTHKIGGKTKRGASRRAP